MMRGIVEVTANGTAARCTVCQKSIAYRTGQHLTMWEKMLASFVNRHNKNCKL